MNTVQEHKAIEDWLTRNGYEPEEEWEQPTLIGANVLIAKWSKVGIAVRIERNLE